MKIRNWITSKKKKLETENSLLHVFSFLHKLSFENSFYFLPILSCQTSFLVSKIENCFWKQKIRGKNSYQTYPQLCCLSPCITYQGRNFFFSPLNFTLIFYDSFTLLIMEDLLAKIIKFFVEMYIYKNSIPITWWRTRCYFFDN